MKTECTVTMSVDEYETLKKYKRAVLESKCIQVNSGSYFFETIYFVGEDNVPDAIQLLKNANSLLDACNKNLSDKIYKMEHTKVSIKTKNWFISLFK